MISVDSDIFKRENLLSLNELKFHQGIELQMKKLKEGEKTKFLQSVQNNFKCLQILNRKNTNSIKLSEGI